MSIMRKGGFQLDTMIPNANPYAELENVAEYFDPVYGNCYTFNAAWSGSKVRKLFVTYYETEHHAVTTKTNRLDLLLFLPLQDFAETPTAILSFHDPNIAPNMRNPINTWRLIPGRLYRYFISKKTSILLPPPYQTNCTDYDQIGTTAARPGLLEENLCKMECLENATLAECGVVDYMVSPFTLEAKDKMGRNVRQGDTENQCAQRLIEEKNIHLYCESVCRQPCRKLTYRVKEKTRIWPLPYESYKYTYILDFWVYVMNISYGWKLSKDFVNKQVLLVSVEPDTEESITYNYHASFQEIEVFSYFGGYLGMWVGYSVLSVAAIAMGALWSWAIKCFKKRNEEKNDEKSAY
ncbi:degenerin unc-8-like [Tachypleus tridentatus]|uniref:degenerin unc-8-like n=1 Tax=Tachypleus tridentatus TaxID=6853 RepID=UPI003FD557CE